MSVLRVREKSVCIILLIILSCHGVQSTSEPEPEPEPEKHSNPPIPGSIRFANGATKSGRLEIYYEEEWGTICNDGWTRTEAMVVCKSLGFSQGEPLLNITEGSGKIFLADVRCKGTEDSIVQCDNNKFGVHNCNHSTDAGVECDDIATAASMDNSVDSCDFDRGTCGYILSTGFYQWKRQYGSTPSSNTGPSRDHSGQGNRKSTSEYWTKTTDSGYRPSTSGYWNRTTYQGYITTPPGYWNRTSSPGYKTTPPGYWNRTSSQGYRTTTSGYWNRTTYQSYPSTTYGHSTEPEKQGNTRYY